MLATRKLLDTSESSQDMVDLISIVARSLLMSFSLLDSCIRR
jgi:hypothetical protein